MRESNDRMYLKVALPERLLISGAKTRPPLFELRGDMEKKF